MLYQSHHFVAQSGRALRLVNVQVAGSNPALVANIRKIFKMNTRH